MDGRLDTDSRHGAWTQAFHWLTAVLALAAYALSKGDGYSLYSAEADWVRRAHETLGLLVLVVVALRLLRGLIVDMPAKPPMPRWMSAAAKLFRPALYGLLIAIPATAVLGTWLEGIPLTLIGFDIAPGIARAHRLGQQIMATHILLGNVLPWGAGAHAAAALFHHFYLRDDVLLSMLPKRGRERRKRVSL